MTGSGSGPIEGGDDDGLVGLLAADERAIKDNGFSQRVQRDITRTGGARKVTLYGAGMLGFGIAAGSVSKAASDSPEFSAWVHSLSTMVANVDLNLAAQGTPYMFALAAIVGGLMFAGVALAVQGR